MDLLHRAAVHGGRDLIALTLPLGSDLKDAPDSAFLRLIADGELAALQEKWSL